MVKSQVKSKSKGRKLSTLQQYKLGAAVACVLVALTVSLPHIAGEMTALMGCHVVFSWAMAIAIDCGMLVSKTHLTTDKSARKTCWTILVVCSLFSVCLNCHAFTTEAKTTFAMVMGVACGCFIPSFAVAMSMVASSIALNLREKK